MIEVGEWIRTKSGKIDVVINDDYYMSLYIECHKGLVEIENIVKHSKNLIDLIEEGDYVNGQMVTKIKEWKSSKDGYFRYAVTCHYEIIRVDEIKSIVTHEQFKSIEYRVETEEKK